MSHRLRIEDSGPVLTERQLYEVEQRLGISLPLPYRQFLRKYNGGRPTPSCFRYKHERGPYTGSEIAWFLSVNGPHENDLEQEFTFLKRDHSWLPDNLVPIATDPFGNSVCISVAGKDRGAVYFRDVEGIPGRPGTGVAEWKNIHLVADSFDELLEGLTEPPQPN